MNLTFCQHFHHENLQCDFIIQVLVAEAKAHEDKIKEMNEIVDKLKDLCDPTAVEQRAASVAELHGGTFQVFH